MKLLTENYELIDRKLKYYLSFIFSIFKLSLKIIYIFNLSLIFSIFKLSLKFIYIFYLSLLYLKKNSKLSYIVILIQEIKILSFYKGEDEELGI